MQGMGIPGAAFVFVRDGRTVYERGYGVSDVSDGTPVDPAETIWPIASITKLITSVAALQLVERGLLALDEDINRYLVRVQVPSQGYPPLTLRHLLSHTSGLDELPGGSSMAEVCRTWRLSPKASSCAIVRPDASLPIRATEYC